MPQKRIKRIVPPILTAAKEHRQRATSAEDVLWSAVRGQQIRGIPFRRQHPVGRFILDFYCPRKKLCIELDGGIHEEQQERDEARTQALADLGIRVIRFRNDEVLADLADVVRRIEEALQEPPPPLRA
jgi:very-short-patch-repair endonuclease